MNTQMNYREQFEKETGMDIKKDISNLGYRLYYTKFSAWLESRLAQAVDNLLALSCEKEKQQLRAERAEDLFIKEREMKEQTEAKLASRGIVLDEKQMDELQGKLKEE